jgi:DNA invertase Pin-like site-specific DNA recombinase
MHAERKPKAYSYLRFSTPEQLEGDSFRRQWSAAQAYAERHNLELHHELTFHDMGVPAFRGANVERGKLAAFRRAVEDGRVVAGAYLLVEDFVLARTISRKLTDLLKRDPVVTAHALAKHDSRLSKADIGQPVPDGQVECAG